MRAALAVSILAALLAEGGALSCYICMSKTGEPCTGVSEPCPAPADSCLTMSIETTTLVMTSKVLVRTCGNSSDCNQVVSTSNPQMSVRGAMSCCNTDNCTPPQPAVPPASTKKNGVSCPWCVAIDYASCSTQETMGCTGDEKKCLHSATKLTIGAGGYAFAMRGCATESLCNAPRTSSHILGGTSMNVDVGCTDGGTRTEHSLFMPVLAGLALLKIF